MMARLLAFLLTLLAVASPAAAQKPLARAFAPWTAKWIAHPDAPPQGAGVYHFRKDLVLERAPKRFVVNVSADNRYRLFVNGSSVTIGPARGDLMHWRYETVDLAPFLKPGNNIVAALVWNWGEYKPGFQISHRTAFLLRGEGEAKIADTDASWQVYWNKGYGFTKVSWPDNGGWYVASPGETLDASHYPWGWEQGDGDSGWLSAKPVLARPDVADGALPRGSQAYGDATEWQLIPRTIPAMEEKEQRFARIRRAEGIDANPGFLRGDKAFVIPANRKVSLLIDQDVLTMGYPVLVTSGGKGATATLSYAEALFDAKNQKGNRNEIEGKTIRGLRDRIAFDGGEDRRFQTLWLRTWRYIQLDIQTADQPLTIADFHSIFTAYPFEQKAAFASDQDWIPAIWDINWRVFRLSAFESFWDTPYYEQLQYVGDTRIEALLSMYQTGDARLARHAITLFHESRTPEGLTAGSWPSSIPAYIPPFSLWWIATVHDYWMLADDPEFVAEQLAGTRGVIGWYERHIDREKAMLGPMPFWNFLDWAGAYDRGVPPGAENGNSAAITLQLVYTFRLAAEMEAKLGEPGLARRYRETADRLFDGVVRHCWDPGRQLFADSPEKKSFSQHTNALAILNGWMSDGWEATPNRFAFMHRVLNDTSLVPASYYFRFYVDEALHVAGMGNFYLDRLAPWRQMIALGLTTTPENPEPTRSDSHAWSAHPNYHLLATVLGIRPASPGFRTVSIAPAIGMMRRVSGRMPHPKGMIEVRLETSKRQDRLLGEITLPPGVTGEFHWLNQTILLAPGHNRIE